ncbi:amidohydrolase [uncultured Lutibacter sp.]|uniref:amidohydrolase n=1 Tax=uncultured Lutibacter sp. TaxID=437739 RepID=UPI00260F8EC8|nr:amidohydrolase [uncultured Lutibacter sp.]
MQHLKIALIQSEIVWQNAELNRINFIEMIKNISKDVDLIVFPEMFTTGFSMQPNAIAESMDGKTVQWMQKLALKKQAAVAGSVIIKDESKFYNRFLFVHPSGKIEFYNKRHLFTLAGEEKVYTAGEEKVIINYKGWKICPQVCYDLRFPVFSRNIEEYDVLLYVANWPKLRILAWDTLLKARAIENMCYTIGVNRIGADANNLEYNGHSAVYNCLGEIQSNLDEEKSLVQQIELNKSHIIDTRKKLNFLNDRDSFQIN